MKRYKTGDKLKHNVLDREAVIIHIEGGVIWIRTCGSNTNFDFSQYKYWDVVGEV